MVLFRNRFRIEDFLPGLSGRRLASSFTSSELIERWDDMPLEAGLTEDWSKECGFDASLSAVSGRRSSMLGSRKMPLGACVRSRSSALMKLMATKPSLEGSSPGQDLVRLAVRRHGQSLPGSLFPALAAS